MLARGLDAAAAFVLSAGVLTIAIGVKEMPTSVEKALGLVAVVWAGLLIVGGLSAGIGAILRPQSYPKRAVTRRGTVSLGLEYAGWALVAGCAAIFSAVTAMRFGIVDGALSVGTALALGLLAAGKWWPIQQALRRARQNERSR